MKHYLSLRDKSGTHLVSLLLVILLSLWVFSAYAIFVAAERHAFNGLVNDAPALFGGTLAGLGALFAAVIAYLGATRKIHFDREVEASARVERTHNLLLKVENGARTLIVQLKAAISEIKRGDSKTEVGKINDPKLIGRSAIILPKYVMEGWDNLSLLPPDAITSLRILSLQLLKAQQSIEHFLTTLEDRDSGGYSSFAQELIELYEDALEAADNLTIEIESELEPLFYKL